MAHTHSRLILKIFYYRKLTMEMKITKQDMNPWDVSSIFNFTYYCCPECDWKDQNKQNFVNHAFTYHTSVSQGFNTDFLDTNSQFGHSQSE